MSLTMKPTVRICSLEIANIKNVRQGRIDMPNRLSGYTPGRGELVGIYGQNGSGKTSVIHALALLRLLICGKPLDDETSSLITFGESESTLSLLLKVESDVGNHFARYTVTIGRDDEGARVRHESFAIKADVPKARTNMVAEFNEPSQPTMAEFAPQASYTKVLSNSTRQELFINKVLAYQERTSYIFSKRFYPLLSQQEGEYAAILQAVHCFAEGYLLIVDHKESGLVNVNWQPIPISHINENCSSSELGRCLINLNAPSRLPLGIYKEFMQSLEHMNQVMCTIIPGFNLRTHELGTELDESSGELMRFELLASRQGIEIPLKYESDGIKKIISILLYWIIVSNTPGSCLVVDELDASIFEYLLGELLSVWEENAQGQLIFTAHNLHPLEMLDKSSVVFTTIDSQNRFIRLKNVKASNNLRDVYLRSIFIGGQEYELYEQTNKTEIARAIRKTIPRYC